MDGRFGHVLGVQIVKRTIISSSSTEIAEAGLVDGGEAARRLRLRRDDRRAIADTETGRERRDDRSEVRAWTCLYPGSADLVVYSLRVRRVVVSPSSPRPEDDVHLLTYGGDGQEILKVVSRAVAPVGLDGRRRVAESDERIRAKGRMTIRV